MTIRNDNLGSVAAWRLAVRYRLARLVLGFLVRTYVRLRAEHLDRVPPPPYLLCFNHLNWTDPFVILVLWPPSPRVFFYGPREEDMTRGLRNRLISWVGTSVPFKPGKNDMLTSTRRALTVLRGGHPLAIAAEGTVGVDENEVLPLSPGAAFFAIRAGVPIVPVAINGTRWLRFGKTIRVRVAEAIPTAGLRADAGTVDLLTAQLHASLRAMVSDYGDLKTPGPFGRWLTEAFNERPWLDASTAEVPALPSGQALAQVEEAHRQDQIDAKQ